MTTGSTTTGSTSGLEGNSAPRERQVAHTASRSRAAAATVHLGISFALGVMAFLAVYFVWYPHAFWEMSGGRSLFFLVLSVDIVIGPLITLTIYNPRKSRRALAFDLTVIGVLQTAALCYGVWTIAQARPLFAVFNVDRITVVTASDLKDADMLAAERPQFRSIPWSGPKLIATRHAKNSDETLERVSSATAGRDVPELPKYYIPYSEAVPEVLAHLHALNTLADKNPEQRAKVQAAISGLHRDPQELGFLPTIARKDWVAIVDKKSAAVVGYWPFNGF
jgi:hypothetical protein